MKLVIVRHAHRDKPQGGSADNGLSDLGRVQAQALGEFYERRFSAKDAPLLLSSPKRRCVETLEPISLRAGVKTKIEPSLDENGDLEAKIEKFVHFLRKAEANRVFACSHGDWIPVFLAHAAGASIDPAKGAWIELEWESPGKGRAEVSWVIQDFSLFRR